MKPIQTTKQALRRFLLETQLLPSVSVEADGDQEAQTAATHQKVLEVLRHLECVQIDPVAAVKPNQHLVLAARIPGYQPSLLNELLRDRAVFEYFANAACVIPMEDYPVFEPVRRRIFTQLDSRLEEIRPVADEVLSKLEQEGPLPAKAFQSDQKVQGYWDNTAKTKASSHAINLLMDMAAIQIVGREGNQRLFDLTSRSIPREWLDLADSITEAEALEGMLQKYFRAYRVFEPSDPRLGWQRLTAKDRRETIARRTAEGKLVQLEVEGVKSPYYILAADLNRLLFHQETENQKDSLGFSAPVVPVRFLPPLDNLLWSRKRLEDLFDFEYRWEIYTPAVKRKYGYYAMPILAGDRLIGRMDPRLDTKKQHLTVQLLQIDPGIDYTGELRQRVEQELERFAKVQGALTLTVQNMRIGE
ncbi:winged helix-turn-helix domain-containing protein [Paenibacillus physcomitrellae]|uniref:Winged helix-turn-helix domain-containing protein n=1 Tax=Paenibacillus physcomitrellae TaxID=1619311 RepID=A0ABQ1FT68_9BACL|nr:winged helix DNA-binding domain-containing protein [Paenibacillus physcomitrellae]GGA29964.1 hypothetical protein GCM10010917_13820 [Paenibacillus physcomitrellae]